MKKVFLFVAVLCTLAGQAQKEANRLVIAADLDVPAGQFADAVRFGGGPLAKLLFGVSPEGDVTATTGISLYEVNHDGFPDGWKASYSIVPFLLGYRHHFSGLFLEPQIGVGIYGYRVRYQGPANTISESLFTWAVGLGYARDKIELALRYQSGEKQGESLGEVAVHVGYVLPLKSRHR